MVSPVNENPTLAANNVNGFMSSILAWIRETNTTIGKRDFPGFQLYDSDDLDGLGLTNTCITALTQKTLCDSYLQTWVIPGVGQCIENTTVADRSCDVGCGEVFQAGLITYPSTALIKPLETQSQPGWEARSTPITI